MAAGLTMVTCLTPVFRAITEEMAGSRSHSFQDTVVGLLGLASARTGAQKPKEPREKGAPKEPAGNLITLFPLSSYILPTYPDTHRPYQNGSTTHLLYLNDFFRA